ncbi:MAG: hypothetical protein ACPIOQ_19065 [Promethearchaeia archaeon]
MRGVETEDEEAVVSQMRPELPGQSAALCFCVAPTALWMTSGRAVGGSC